MWHNCWFARSLVVYKGVFYVFYDYGMMLKFFVGKNIITLKRLHKTTLEKIQNATWLSNQSKRYFICY